MGTPNTAKFFWAEWFSVKGWWDGAPRISLRKNSARIRYFRSNHAYFRPFLPFCTMYTLFNMMPLYLLWPCIPYKRRRGEYRQQGKGLWYLIWFNSMLKFCQKGFIQYLIQYCFTQDSIWNIIQLNKNLLIQFKW